MKKIFSILLIFLSISWAISAQTKTIKGTVISSDGADPLIGVSIIVKGTSTGAITNVDGDFSVSAKSSDVLVVTYLGYKSQEISVGNNVDFKILMQEDTRFLDEVVVVGYGIQKKSVVTAAISKVSSNDLELVTPTRIEDVLKGKVSGVQITQSSGQPGSDSKVRIRGIGTINDSNPLYIVDGMPVDGGINYLNPVDIESVEVLKDAASAAIYGTRGANGVILVTTKSGKSGKASITYDFSYGWQNPWKKKSILNATEYMTIMNEMQINDNGSPTYSSADFTKYATNNGTDWQDETFNYNAPVQSHQVGVSGGSDKASYFLSFSYFNQDGIVGGDYDKSNYERYSIRLNNTYTAFETKDRKFVNKIKLGTNIGYSRNISSTIDANTEYGSILGSALTFSPLVPVFSENPEQDLAAHPYAVKSKDGRVYSLPPSGFQEIANPVGMLNQPNGSKNNDDKFVASFWGELQILPQLVFKSSYGADLAFWGWDGYTYPYYLSAQGKNATPAQSNIQSQMNRGYTWQVENVFSYNQDFGLHNISAILGQSAQKSTAQHLGGTAFDPESYDPIKAYLNNTKGGEALETNYGWYGLSDQDPVTFRSIASYFGRLSYNYAERYMLQGSLRYDGSSRFGTNNKWALFPAFSAGWNIKNEAFMENSADWMDVLKLRLSWGKNGNDRIRDLRYQAFDNSGNNYYFGGGYAVGGETYNTNGTLYPGTTPGALANKDIQWEESEQIDLGIDTRFFNSLSFGVDYYKKKTNGMLMDAVIPAYVGQSPPLANVGKMENWGLEFEIGWKNHIRDFNYYISTNASYIQNKLIELGNASGEAIYENAGASGVGAYVQGSNGEVWPYFYGLKTNGLFQNQADIDAYVNKDGNLIQPNAKPGDVRFLDLNEDGKISDEDKTKVGKGMPDWTFGFTIGGDWKGFDANLFFAGSVGNDVFEFAQRGDIPAMNRPDWILERWHGEGTSNRIPRMTGQNPNKNWASSDLYVKDGSYLRLKTAQLGYTLPMALTKKVSIQKFRIFVSGENLLTFTNYDGFEPELAAGSYTTIGVDKGIYPQARTVLIGFNLGF